MKERKSEWAERHDREPFLELHMGWLDKTPHWLRSTKGRSTKGHVSALFRMHNQAGWLSIDAVEYGEKSSKRVMLTLEPAQVTALRTFLNAHNRGQ